MKSKLIVALDVDSYQRATQLVQELAEVVEIFKVGSQLFTRCGPSIVEFIHEQDKKVFLDLKFHDIPNTVAKAVESAASLGVLMLTVHTVGGEEMLRAAAKPIPGRPLVLGVTVLTSVKGKVEKEVVRLAKVAQQCGLDGVISSPREIFAIRKKLGAHFMVVTPGVRPAWAPAPGDQGRVMTPAEAVAAGANCIVVGRPIIEAEKPSAAALRITTEMASVGM
jgi:orotidine-5'-phosphate decarboxylase